MTHAADLDAAICRAVASRTLDENLAIIGEHRLTAAPVQTIADIECDSHSRERRLTVDVPLDGSAVRMHNVFPRFSETPGEIEWAGRAHGRDKETFYRAELGLPCGEVERLASDGII